MEHSVPSAKDILAAEKKRASVKKEYYKALLEQFCRKIKNSVELGKKDAIVTVPTFLVGYPRYDLATTVVYMSRQLGRLGYKVELIGPLDLKVTWRHTKPEEDTEAEISEPNVFLPSLVNLQKTAQKLRVTKKN
ncbi:hypothetical protein EBT25_15970 [bacterium]|jgi:hypothetical protein|nr:hypothetical protein [bacterium]